MGNALKIGSPNIYCWKKTISLSVISWTILQNTGDVEIGLTRFRFSPYVMSLNERLKIFHEDVSTLKI